MSKKLSLFNKVGKGENFDVIEWNDICKSE